MDNDKRVKDLAYLRKMLVNRVTEEIELTLKGKPSSDERLRESLEFLIREQIR